MSDDLDKMYTIEQVIELTGLSRASIYRLSAAGGGGGFPRPVLAGRRAARWLGSELRNWQDRKRQDREAPDVAS